MPREKLADEPMMASLHQLARDGRAWIAAEAAFAQAEVASDGKRLAVMLALVAVGFGCLFTAVILLSVFVVAFFSLYIWSELSGHPYLRFVLPGAFVGSVSV